LEERLAVRVLKSRAEEVRNLLKKLNLLDRNLKPKIEGDYVLFPVRNVEILEKTLSEYSLETVYTLFEKRFRKPRSIKDVLKEIVPENLHVYIPSSIDLVGSIALVDVPEELKDYSGEIGRAIVKLYPKVKTVLSKEGGTVGDYRIRMLRKIFGEDSTETVYREHGCLFKLDLSKVFFNPRMSGERIRIASITRDGEYVLDMFAGVGPFSIIIAKKKMVKVKAVEINPDAYRYLVENIKLNNVSDKVTPVLGDAGKVLENEKEIYDRVIMDLPFKSLEYLDIALKVVKKNGVIHLYTIGEDEDTLEKNVEKVQDKIREMDHNVEILSKRIVLETAPRKFIIVVDLKKIS